MASIHARIIDGEFVYRPYSDILNEYRGQPMTKEEIKAWFEKHTRPLTTEAESDDFLDKRIAVAEQWGQSSSPPSVTKIHSPWIGQKRLIRKRRTPQKLTANDKKWLKEIRISVD